jgi:ubiquitin-like modifier-activating enzyme 5
LFFTPQQVGLSKVTAAKETLVSINPEVIIEDYDMSITGTGN